MRKQLRVRAWYFKQHTTNVGGGLPPKAVVQSINPVTDTALTRASPLPHFLIFSVLEIGSDQNAGRIAPLYFSRMNAFTSGVCRAATSFFTASESLLSSRVTRMFTYGESLPSIT